MSGRWRPASVATGAGSLVVRLLRAALAGLGHPGAACERARARLLLWAPLALGVGIGGWFALRTEPGPGNYALAAVLGVLALVFWLRGPTPSRFPAALLTLACLGFLAAGYRAQSVAAPVLHYRYYGPIEGRIAGIDRASSDRLRLTLDQVRLGGRMAPGDRPGRVRVSLAQDPGFAPGPGLRVMLTGHLMPPPPPAEPGGYDFRRAAFFDGLGAVGYTRAPVLLAAEPAPDWRLAGHRLRMRLSAAIRRAVPGQPGAMAAALATGDRSGLSEATKEAMRRSNLAHLIAISGLHMGMLAGFVFGALRLALALAGQAALVWPTKKIAAVGALIAATAYLWIAGPAVATQRAWIMVSLMLLAVLFDRRALSLRNVALAAVLLLLRAPESLTEPGFQMSFAATTALIVALDPVGRQMHRLPGWARPVAMLLATSLIAGLATTPIAAAHFHRISGYGLAANLLAVPAMGLVIVPSAVLAAVLAPIGLSGVALWAMGKGTAWVIAVAERIAALDGAVAAVATPAPAALPLLATGALLMVLARGAGRSAGLLACLVAGWLWIGGQGARPALLIAPEGELIGLMTAQGRAMSKPGAAFIGGRWLEADGDAALPGAAAARPAFDGPANMRAAQFMGAPLVHVTGKGAAERARAACAGGGIVVSSERVGQPPGGCDLWDLSRLRRTGAVAFDARGHSRTTAETAGQRLWTRR